MIALRFCLLLFCLLCFVPLSAGAGQVQLGAAASLRDAVLEMVAHLAKEHPGITVRTSFAGSGTLARQIELGAPVDIYIAADPAWTAYLQQRNLVTPDSVRILAANRLVVVGRPGPPLASLVQVRSWRRLAIGSPDAVPAGRYARQALTAAGVYDLLAAGHRLVLAKDVRQALAYAERGVVDGAMVYASDGRLARNVVVRYPIDPASHDPIRYPVALTVRGAARPAARTVHAFLLSGAAAEILERFGFQVE